MPLRAALGLGSNLGDRLSSLRRAIFMMSHKGIRVVETSDVFETDPFGEIHQPRFLNACVLVETDLEPHPLLVVLKQLETEIGRVPREHWGPREIDVDILLVEERIIQSEDLVVPHPGIAERPFVLVPLAQIVPEWVHPILMTTIAALAMGVSRDGMLRITKL